HASDGLSVSVVNLPFLNRLDEAWFRSIVTSVAHVFALDNHYVHGGQGSMLGSALARLHLDPAPAFFQFGLTHLPVSGQPEEVLRAHGLDAQSLSQRIRERLRAPAVVH